MIALTGSSGFLGRYMVRLLAENVPVEIKGLTRQPLASEYANVEYIRGDIQDLNNIRNFIEPDCTVINLAYSNITAHADAIEATERFVELCAESGIKRLIHCSSVAVYGRQSGVVTEDTPCDPYDDYGKTKLAIDQILLDKTQGRFELVILRPTVVFGAGGDALMSLVSDLLHRNKIVNYLRSSLFGMRHTHLVPVEYVARAFLFCCQYEGKFARDIYNISMDESVLNNFYNVETILAQALEARVLPYPLLPIPKLILEAILMLAKRPVVNTRVVYSGDRLKNLGFSEEGDLESKLRDFAIFHRSRLATLESQ